MESSNRGVSHGGKTMEVPVQNSALNSAIKVKTSQTDQGLLSSSHNNGQLELNKMPQNDRGNYFDAQQISRYQQEENTSIINMDAESKQLDKHNENTADGDDIDTNHQDTIENCNSKYQSHTSSVNNPSISGSTIENSLSESQNNHSNENMEQLSDNDDENNPECRICRNGASPTRPLFHPCRCSGSIRYTHEDCLTRWLAQSYSQNKCELCHTQFHFEPFYLPHAPDELTWVELASGAVDRLKASTKHLFRIFVVLLVWLFLLPLGTCWIWWAIFWGSPTMIQEVLFRRGLAGVLTDAFYGCLLSSSIVFIFLGFSSLREFLRFNGENPHDAEEEEGEEEEDLDEREEQARVDASDNEGPHDIHATTATYITRNDAPNDHNLQQRPAQSITDDLIRPEDVAGPSYSTHNNESQTKNFLNGNQTEPSLHDSQQDQQPHEDTISAVENETENTEQPGHRNIDDDESDHGNDDLFHNNNINDNPDDNNNNMGNNVEGGGLFGLFDFDAEEVPLEEVVGLRGPVKNLIDNAVTVLISNAIFLSVFVLIPLWIGKMTVKVGLMSLPLVSELYKVLGLENQTSYVGSFIFPVRHSLLATENVISDLTGFTIIDASVLPDQKVALQILAARLGKLFSSKDLKEVQLGGLVMVGLGYALLGILSCSYVFVTTIFKNRYPSLNSSVAKQAISFVSYITTFIKVVALILIEFGLFPLGCGWWLDICTIDFVGSSLESRLAFLREAPWTFTSVHWLLGIVYMVNVSLFVQLLREVLCPDLLWFLRNPDDPDFHPFKELVERPLTRHVKRMCTSVLIYVTLIVLFVYAPSQMCLKLFRSVFPFNLKFIDPLTEVPADLLLFHVCIPLASRVQHAHPKAMLLTFLKSWINYFGELFSVSHLISKEVAERLANESESLSEDENVSDIIRYDQRRQNDRGENCDTQRRTPNYLRLRGACILFFAWLTIMSCSIVIVTLPTVAGRLIFAVLNIPLSHDVYTFGLGFYMFWGMIEIGMHIHHFVRDRDVWIVVKLCFSWALVGTKIAILSVLWIGVIPLIIGVLLELTFILPLRVGINESPHFYFYQDWALGLLILKLWVKIVLSGYVETGWKEKFERIRVNGLGQVRTDFMETLCGIVLPILSLLLLILSIPYVIARGMVPLMGFGYEASNAVFRFIYLVCATCYTGLLIVHIIKSLLEKLHDRIRDDKYLVGRKLSNYTGLSENGGVDTDLGEGYE